MWNIKEDAWRHRREVTRQMHLISFQHPAFKCKQTLFNIKPSVFRLNYTLNVSKLKDYHSRTFVGVKWKTDCNKIKKKLKCASSYKYN